MALFRLATYDHISLAGKLNAVSRHLPDFPAQQVAFGWHILLKHSTTAFGGMCGRDYVCASVAKFRPANDFQHFAFIKKI